MNFKRIVSLACLAGAVPGAALAATYKYVDYAVPEDFQQGTAYFSIDTSTGRYDTGDAGDAVTFCDKSESLYCLRTASLSFGVPKSSLRGGQAWEFDHRRYQVLRKSSLDVLGVSREVWVIAASGTAGSQVFYYSEAHGLLGIKYLGSHGHDVHFFVLAGNSGFPR